MVLSLILSFRAKIAHAFHRQNGLSARSSAEGGSNSVAIVKATSTVDRLGLTIQKRLEIREILDTL
jgi:hypothetical protein